MQASDVVSIVAAVSVAVLIGAAASLVAALSRTLRETRAAVQTFEVETLEMLVDLRAAVRDACREVDRVERLVTAAEGVTDAVDSAQRLALRTLASPVVKAMAFGAGVSRGAQRLREGDAAEGVDDPRSGAHSQGGAEPRRAGRSRGRGSRGRSG